MIVLKRESRWAASTHSESGRQSMDRFPSLGDGGEKREQRLPEFARQTTRTGTPFRLSNCTSGHLSKKTKTIIRKDPCAPKFRTAHLTTAKTWEQPERPPTDGWIRNSWFIRATEYYSAFNKWKPPVCNDMDGPRGYYAEWNKQATQLSALWAHAGSRRRTGFQIWCKFSADHIFPTR